MLKPLKLIAAPSDDSLLPRTGVRGFPHWGLWQQRDTGFGRDMLAFLAEGGWAGPGWWVVLLSGECVGGGVESVS